MIVVYISILYNISLCYFTFTVSYLIPCGRGCMGFWIKTVRLVYYFSIIYTAYSCGFFNKELF